MSVDRFLDRKYHADNYNCAHFVCEAWDEVTGEPMGDRLRSFLLPRGERTATYPLRRAFKRLDRPASPCLALMRRVGIAPHIGIFKNGRILHITESGVRFEPFSLAVMHFNKVEFFK